MLNSILNKFNNLGGKYLPLLPELGRGENDQHGSLTNVFIFPCFVPFQIIGKKKKT